MSVLARLLAHRRITETGCWEWTGAVFKSTGYGQINVGGRPTTVHRAMARIVFGPSPLHACHTCDNRLCFNPADLFYGTPLANMQDASRKGRTATGDRNGTRTHPERRARGERMGSAYMTAAEVMAIRGLYQKNVYGLKRLARQFSTTEVNVLRIVRRDTWRHL